VRTVLFVQISSGMGGASHSLLLLASRLHRYGYRPIIAGQQDREGLWHEADLRGIRYYPLFLTSWARSDNTIADLRYLPNRLNSIQRVAGICARESVTLVHTNLPFCLEGALAAKLLGLPHVMHVRDEFSPLYRTYWGGTRGAVVGISRMSDRVIAVSRNIKHSFDKHGVGDRVRVVPNAVEVPPVPAGYDPRTVRQSFRLPPCGPLVGVFGSVAARKGQIDFVRAMKAILATRPSAHAIIVGDAVDSYGQEVKKETASLALSERVHFIPHQANVWPLLRAVDIVVVPSRAEGFGRIIVEGMAAGKPVVASAVGGILDIVQHEENGLLVPSARPDELARAVLRLLKDASLARRLGERGAECARERYGPEAHVRRVVAVYDELVSG